MMSFRLITRIEVSWNEKKVSEIGLRPRIYVCAYLSVLYNSPTIIYPKRKKYIESNQMLLIQLGRCTDVFFKFWWGSGLEPKELISKIAKTIFIKFDIISFLWWFSKCIHFLLHGNKLKAWLGRVLDVWSKSFRNSSYMFKNNKKKLTKWIKIKYCA